MAVQSTRYLLTLLIVLTGFYSVAHLRQLLSRLTLPTHAWLEIGKVVETELRSREFHRYGLDILSGDYLWISVEQLSRDVMLTLKTFDGLLIEEVDLLKRVGGAEELFLVSPVNGPLVLTVTTRSQEDDDGQYRITFRERRSGNWIDQLRIPAEKDYAQARELQLNNRSLSLAIALYRRTLQSWEVLNDPRWEASTLDNIGRCYWLQGRSKEALTFYRRALPVWREASDQRSEAKTLINLGMALRQLDRYEDARNAYKDALEALEGLDEPELRSRSLSNLGVALQYLGYFDQAERVLKEALRIRLDSGDELGSARTLNNLGSNATDAGHLDNAVENLRQAIQLADRHDDIATEAAALANLGVVYDLRGELSDALQLYARSLALHENLKHRRGQARVLRHLGTLSLELGQVEIARDYFEKSRYLNQALGEERNAAISSVDLGWVFHTAGQFDRALHAYAESMRYLEGAADDSLWSYTFEKQARTYTALTQFEAAIDSFSRGIEHSIRARDLRREARLRAGLGRALLAVEHFRSAIAEFERALFLTTEIGDEMTRAEAFTGLAEAQAKLGDYSAAIAASRSGISIFEAARRRIDQLALRRSLLASRSPDYDQAIQIAMNGHFQEPTLGYDRIAFSLSEQARARTFLDLLGAIGTDLKDGCPPKLIHLERESLLELIILRRQRERIARETQYSSTVIAQIDADIIKVRNSLREIDATLSLECRPTEKLAATSPTDLSEIQRLLDPETVLVSYKLGTPNSFLWVVSRSGVSAYHLPSKKLIEDLVERIRKSLMTTSGQLQDYTVFDDPAGELSRYILRPAAKLLDGKRIVVIADGKLQYLPFAVLADPSHGGKPLVAKHELLRIPSASAFVALQLRSILGKERLPSIAVFADPVFSRTDPRVPDGVILPQSEKEIGYSSTESLPLLERFRRVPFASHEADRIRKLFPTGTYIHDARGFEATKNSLKDITARPFRFLHLATHGFIDDVHPELSGLVFSLLDKEGNELDGHMLLHEVFKLKLSCELVVLSACNTALGTAVRGEGIVGLVQGFLQAGSENVVATLWPVDDLATATFMERFYFHLVRRGLSPSAALRDAQISMLGKPQVPAWRHPYYWAGFVIFGSLER